MSEHNRILVAIDGGEGGRAAIRYAAARRDGSDLWLVHVVDLAVATGVFYPYGYDGLADQVARADRARLLVDAESNVDVAAGEVRDAETILKQAREDSGRADAASTGAQAGGR